MAVNESQTLDGVRDDFPVLECSFTFFAFEGIFFFEMIKGRKI